VSGVHQFVPMLHHGDAVGRHTVAVRDVLVSRGVASRIYVELIDPETETETEVYSAYADQHEVGDTLLYQMATASGLAPWLADRPETLVVNYHNITPPELYAAWDNGLARHQVAARNQMAALAHRASLGVAVSSFNERDLVAAGYRATAVVPPAAMLPTSAGPGMFAHSARTPRGARWLCVGRVAPNKTIEDALMALLVTRAHQDPLATLTVIGRPVVPSYTRALHRFVADLGLRDAVQFLGHVSDSTLAEALARSDVLVLVSAHEGFGVPLVEAMTIGLPVVANRAGALPEVVGDGGTLVDTRDPWALADAVAGVLGDPARSAAMTDAARLQLISLNLSTAGDRLVDLLLSLATG